MHAIPIGLGVGVAIGVALGFVMSKPRATSS